jgi:hypothetical protein
MKEILESSFSGDSSNDDEEKVEENESEWWINFMIGYLQIIYIFEKNYFN